MTTLSELKEQLAVLQEKIEAFEKPKGSYVPKNGDMVYLLTGIGELNGEHDNFVYSHESEFHRKLSELGLVVPTIEEFHKRVAEFKARTKLLRCDGARRGFKAVGDNYSIAREGVEYVIYNYFRINKGAAAYFDTEEQAKSALNSMTKEELNALLPMVEA